MILDSLLVFSDNQDIHAASVASTNSIDTGTRANYDDAWESHPGTENVGNGRPVKVAFNITNIVVASSNPTIKCAIQHGTDNSSFTDLVDSAVYTPTTGQNISFDLFIPEGTVDEYLQAYYTIAGTGSFTSINVTAAVVLDFQSNRSW